MNAWEQIIANVKKDIQDGKYKDEEFRKQKSKDCEDLKNCKIIGYTVKELSVNEVLEMMPDNF